MTQSTYNRESKFGNQIPGAFVDNDGYLKSEFDSVRSICRWSLRPKSLEIDFKNRWHSKAETTIKDGDEVRLYCHSYRAGSFRSLTKKDDDLDPPYWAPSVYRKADDDRLRVLGLDFSGLKDSKDFREGLPQ